MLSFPTARALRAFIIPVAALVLSSQVAAADRLSTDFADSGSLQQGAFNPFVTNTGSVNTQGDTTTNADVARSTFGVNGSGIKIGVISDSFNRLGGYSTGVANGNLPANVQIVKDDSASFTSDEGRAMLEIIHDLAPGAQLYFHSAFNNTPIAPVTGGSTAAPDQTIADAIDALVAAGVDIIVDDVSVFTAPTFQDGPAAQAVNNAKAAGVAYFSAAGNDGTNAYVHQANIGSGVHDFNPGPAVDQLFNITIPAFSTLRSVLQWSDPYDSVGGAATSDYDLYLTNAGGTALFASFNDQLADEDPVEFLSIYNGAPSAFSGALAIVLFGGSSNETLRLLVSGAIITDPNDINSAPFYGHAAAEGGVAVAAHPYFDLDDVESFSTLGGINVLFDENGNPIAPSFRTVDITGPDGVSTSVSGFNAFFGTSAAAPHLAAVAALVLQRAENLGAVLGVDFTVDDLYEILFNTAIDIESPGFDNLSGFGRVDAFAAVAAVPEPTMLGAVVLGALALRRRR